MHGKWCHVGASLLGQISQKHACLLLTLFFPFSPELSNTPLNLDKSTSCEALQLQLRYINCYISKSASKALLLIEICFSLTITQFHAHLGAKLVLFSFHSFLACLIISGTLRLVSLIKISEEAGLQYFGPDNVAIQRVRMIILTTSGLLSLVLIKDPGSFKLIFYPSSEVEKVITHFNIFPIATIIYIAWYKHQGCVTPKYGLKYIG